MKTILILITLMAMLQCKTYKMGARSSGQTFALLLDTGSSNLWVIDDSCDTEACDGYIGSIYTRRKFNATASSTFHTENSTITIQYGSGWCYGQLAMDTQEFLDAEDIADIFGYMPFDGIFGLAWPAISVENVTPPMQNLLPTLDKPLFTIWLDRKVISDTGTSWIGGPLYIMYAVVNQTDAQYNWRYGIYTVDCSTMMHQPDMQFTINGVTYNITSEEYILDLELGGGEVGVPSITQKFVPI
ncbi:unnamed protein product [Angiostrongylus costaricensis]|uniref:Peptidase A1 domain-containing protein n=1 Tax=Angiostrongylus costaricensis TaxID=334426 RepID=A0A0R3PRW1_ANGCS|nr:unnamed protein product [Angiostrongylus costaricensis]